MSESRGADWAAYEARYGALRERMRVFMESVAEVYDLGVWEDSADDSGFYLDVPHPDGVADHALGVSFTLWDSGDADDGVYGVHGNVNLSVVEWGGRVVAAYVPYNYTSQVWVDYGDDAEWSGRMKMIEDLRDDLIDKINVWKA